MSSGKAKGIGGIFFKCQDPEKIKEWYQQHLGLKTYEYGKFVHILDPENNKPNYGNLLTGFSLIFTKAQPIWSRACLYNIGPGTIKHFNFAKQIDQLEIWNRKSQIRYILIAYQNSFRTRQ